MEDGREKMMKNDTLAVILAAGKGTRMRSELPKVLTPVCGRPMVEYPLEALRFAGVKRIFAVIGYRAEEVRKVITPNFPEVEFVLQTEQKGTGHAVRTAAEGIRKCLAENPGMHIPVLVVAGDTPMMCGETLRELLAFWRSGAEKSGETLPPACVLGTIRVENPHGLGRILRDSAGNFVGIIEEKDATPEQRAIREVNQSYYVFDAAELVDVLDALTPNNAQGEYYITDAPALLLSRGKKVFALPILRPTEAVSVNTPEELAVVEKMRCEMK